MPAGRVWPTAQDQSNPGQRGHQMTAGRSAGRLPSLHPPILAEMSNSFLIGNEFPKMTSKIAYGKVGHLRPSPGGASVEGTGAPIEEERHFAVSSGSKVWHPPLRADASNIANPPEPKTGKLPSRLT